MALTPEEITKIEEEERVRAQAREKYAQPQESTPKQKGKSHFVRNFFIIIGIFVLISVINSATHKDYGIPNNASDDCGVQAAQNADPSWKASDAGKICNDHPAWGKCDCDKLASGKIWIGMTLDMLVYKRGNPDDKNVSNVGSGNEYQYCWDKWKPSCFYDHNADGIMDSYN